MQKEVAKIIGVSRSTYINLECGITRQFPKNLPNKLAEFYGVPAADFPDDYNRFLRSGQGKSIRAYRQKLGMGRKSFCRLTGIPLSSLRAWEDEKKIVSLACWKRFFRGRTASTNV